ncbi:MAG TPA: TetR/AcrR family transcriptional regulator [Bacilli bacterium]|nr:TetR/AcrR family transcriptional regulator [Bacilli bacterium]
METSDKHQAILQAAGKIFGTKGYHATKVEEIAEAAGVGKGTVYLYFKDKNNLLLEVTRFHFRTYIELIEQEMDKHDSARDKLRAYVHSHMSHFPELIKFNKLNFEHLLKQRAKEETGDRNLGEYHQTFFRMIEELVRYGIERGEFQPVDATHGAMMIWGTLHAYVMRVMFSDLATDELTPQKADALIDLILNGLGS